MGNLSLAWRVEEACLNAWPSPKQLVMDGWLLRFSGGSTRRTNSVNPLRADTHDSDSIIAKAEILYHAQNQASIFRVPSIAIGMDAPLERANYLAEGETCALFADLSDFDFVTRNDVQIAGTTSGEWLSAKRHMTPVSDTTHQAYLAMIDAIVLPKAFVAARYKEQIVSVAYGVIHDDLLVVESVVTAPGFQRQRFAHGSVQKLIVWARHVGARGACLQVVAENAPARALYRKLGFQTELYRYHYRREKPGSTQTL